MYKTLLSGLQVSPSLYHQGWNIYKSKADCLKVLTSLRSCGLPWWSDEVEDFISSVEKTPSLPGSTTEIISSISNNSTLDRTKNPYSSIQHEDCPIMVLDGLDGVGKSTIATKLAKRLSGYHIATPDKSLSFIRPHFVDLGEPFSRAFFCGANYLAAGKIITLLHYQRKPVIVDRWWYSTASMAFAHKMCEENSLDGLRDSKTSDFLLSWPLDLLSPNVSIFLRADEVVRTQRLRHRNSLETEEKLLQRNERMRSSVLDYFQHLPNISFVDVVNYKFAINQILDILREKYGFSKSIPSSAYYSEKEIASIRPY